MLNILQDVIAGLFNGGAIGIAGYMKSLDNGQLPDFESQKFLETVVIGGVIGAIGGYMGLDYATATGWLASSGGIAIIEYGGKAIVRWVRQKILHQTA